MFRIDFDIVDDCDPLISHRESSYEEQQLPFPAILIMVPAPDNLRRN